jgi:glycosyltransferase involved in cell wall biosynthesis
MAQLPAVVVLPCLNEEEALLDTCRSLGFARGGDGQDSSLYLVIVDNDSTDSTFDIAEAIRNTSMPNSVYVVREAERGYVPPRHTGVAHAGVMAQAAGWSDVVILQADADTTYDGEYVGKIRESAAEAGENAFLVGTAEFPEEFRSGSPDYVSHSSEVDTRVLTRLGVPESDDLICTDAVCAYRLSDYLTWGGHLREYSREGDEIHAETTRLYMRSLSRGSRKVLVPGALAYPSARKTVRRPGEEFATAGFPREASWRQAWRVRYSDDIGTEGIPLDELSRADLEEIIRTRERHLIALFGVLPLHVFRSLGRDAAPGCDAQVRAVAEALPRRGADDLYRSPGLFIEDVLRWVDERGVWPREE